MKVMASVPASPRLGVPHFLMLEKKPCKTISCAKEAYKRIACLVISLIGSLCSLRVLSEKVLFWFGFYKIQKKPYKRIACLVISLTGSLYSLTALSEKKVLYWFGFYKI